MIFVAYKGKMSIWERKCKIWLHTGKPVTCKYACGIILIKYNMENDI